MRKTILIIIATLAYIQVCYGLDITYVTNLDFFDKGAVTAQVVDIEVKNDSCTIILIKCNDKTGILLNKWTKNDVGEFTPVATIIPGGTYEFYIERTNQILDLESGKALYDKRKNNFPFEKKINCFRVYNVVNDKLLYLSDSKLNNELLDFVIHGDAIYQITH